MSPRARAAVPPAWPGAAGAIRRELPEGVDAATPFTRRCSFREPLCSLLRIAASSPTLSSPV